MADKSKSEDKSTEQDVKSLRSKIDAITFKNEQAKKIVLGELSEINVKYSAIQRHGHFQVDTRVLMKQYRATVTKRRVLESTLNEHGEVVMIDTVPWLDQNNFEYQS